MVSLISFLIGGLSHLKAPKAPLYAACVGIAKAWGFSAVIDLIRIESDFHAGSSNLWRVARVFEAILRPERFTGIPGAWRIGLLPAWSQARLLGLGDRANAQPCLCRACHLNTSLS
jgi:hypothetical protein